MLGVHEARSLAIHSEFLRYKLRPEEFTLDYFSQLWPKGKQPALGQGFRLNIYNWLGCSLPELFEYSPDDKTLRCKLFLNAGSELDQVAKTFSLYDSTSTAHFLFSRSTYKEEEWPRITAAQVADRIDAHIQPIIAGNSPKIWQVRLLEKLGQFLIYRVPPENFNLNHWLCGSASELTDSFKEHRPCNSTGCAVGWMPIALPEKFTYYATEATEGRVGIFERPGFEAVDLRQIRAAFGIDEYRFDMFFMPSSYPVGERSALHVGKRIEGYCNGIIAGEYRLPKIDWYPEPPALPECVETPIKHGRLYGLVSRLKGRIV